MARTSSLLDQEQRELPLAQSGLEIREVDGDQRFVGHAAVFDVRAAIGNPLKWGFYEEVATGAFTKTLQEGDARFLLDHDSYYVVSRMSAGTLTLAEDAVGLAVDSALDSELSYVGDLKTNIRNKNITGMSFGFYVIKDEWFTEDIETKDGQSAEVEVRRILEVRLIEVSAVSFPAYEETDAGLRSALRSRGDVDAIRRRVEYRPQLAELLDEPWARHQLANHEPVTVSSAPDTVPEPAETTPGDANPTDTEPAETTRNAPTELELAAARLRVLRAQLRRPAA